MPDAPLLVGFSGGMDSTVLLHALAAQPAARERGLRAIHVDHGLHADSGAWAEQCGRTCAALGVPLDVRRVDVDDDGCGPEAAARAARMDAFATSLRPGEWLALAHHLDDQAETQLLRLLRASGSAGLAGMRAVRPFAAGALWRPLLGLPRQRLHAYATAHALRWIEDPSNTGLDLDRNFLRHRVLPVLAERWPHAAASLARSAQLLAADADDLAADTARRLAQLQGLDPGVLHRQRLSGESPSWRARILRAWIHGLGLPPLPARALAAIERELLPARGDAQACVAWPGAEVRAWHDALYADAGKPALPADWSAAWDGRTPVVLPTGETLSCIDTGGGDATLALAAIGPLRLAARQGGERIRLPGREHTHAVKKLLQSLEVPPWERERLPLVFAADGELLAVGDVLTSARLYSVGLRCRIGAAA